MVPGSLVPDRKSLDWFGTALLALILSCPAPAFASAVDLIQQGDKAFATKDFQNAEKPYEKALELEPDNYRLIYSLAEVKSHLGKYEEAEALANRVLARPLAKGRNVRVYLEGESEPLEAELVDENVMAPPHGVVIEGKFIKPTSPDPVPHFRLFMKKTGKMQLVPKSKTRVEYIGVPSVLHEKMVVLLREIKKKIIASVSPDTEKEDEMVEIEGGCFLMGSENGHADEWPVHEVCLSSFKMDKFEVTQSAFQAAMDRNPSEFVGADLPVERVNWVDADKYCRKKGKRLPTEAQWEYAARGGTKTEFYFGNQYVETGGNFCDSLCSNEMSRNHDFTDGFASTSPVGSFPPNPYGLYDMAGNVSEWMEDWFAANYYLSSPKKDPPGPLPSMYKLVRGGGWVNSAEYLRSSRRAYLWPEYRLESQGFRCVLNAGKK